MSNIASILLDFSAICSLVSNVFIKIHEYTNKFVFISAHTIRVLCCIITLLSNLLLNRARSNFVSIPTLIVRILDFF